MNKDSQQSSQQRMLLVFNIDEARNEVYQFLVKFQLESCWNSCLLVHFNIVIQVYKSGLLVKEIVVKTRIDTATETKDQKWASSVTVVNNK